LLRISKSKIFQKNASGGGNGKFKNFNIRQMPTSVSFSKKKERGIATAARPKNSENSDKNRAQNLIP